MINAILEADKSNAAKQKYSCRNRSKTPPLDSSTSLVLAKDSGKKGRRTKLLHPTCSSLLVSLVFTRVIRDKNDTLREFDSEK
jgi:hypothetical protein